MVCNLNDDKIFEMFAQFFKIWSILYGFLLFVEKYNLTPIGTEEIDHF